MLWAFTKVPVAEALDVVSSQLSHDNSLEEQTTPSQGTICQVAKLYLQSTYFQIKYTFYEQLEGAAMGSLLSPVIATLYMEALEEKTLHCFPLQPMMWLRYVDDIFVVWSHGMEVLGDFDNHLNTQDRATQFTTN